MVIKEDAIELQGSDYDRKLFDMKKGSVQFTFMVKNMEKNWEYTNIRPNPGQGEYIERMPNGECRKYSNTSEENTTFHRV